MPDLSSVVELNLKRHLTQLRAENRVFRKLIVAYSGGKDSRVLLHVLGGLTGTDGFPVVEAVHIHHGLSANADEWAEFCRQSSAAHHIPCHVCHLNITRSPRTSIEDTARTQRYQQLFKICREQEGALLLGQHQDDQLETLLLQLKRGAGPKGLAGMGECQERDGITLLRPMLGLSQQEISNYAKMNNLSWVEDESNTDTRFDRNFLRQDILPMLLSRWPGVAKAAGRSAALCAEQEALLSEVTKERLADIEIDGQVQVSQLLNYSVAWQKRLLREWLAERKCPAPSYAQMGELLNYLHARNDSQPELKLKSHVIRRWGGLLWLTPPVQAAPPSLPVETGKPVVLSWFNTVLEMQTRDGDQEDLHLLLRTGLLSLRITPQNSPHSKPLKAWLKEWNVPPWVRPHVPVIFSQQEPLVVCLPHRIVILSAKPERLHVSYRIRNTAVSGRTSEDQAAW